MDTQRMLTVAAFCARYAVGRTNAYEELRTGRLGSVKQGRRRLIPEEAAEHWHRARLAEAIEAGTLRPEQLEPLDAA